MKKTAKILMMTLTLMGMTACDYVVSKEFQRERSDSTYRTAMDAYRAGRLDEAVAGLKKVCREDPSNSSARFQLACLLQDHSKDALGAYVAFTEYLQQKPSSEKARLARERLQAGERLLAVELADKYGLNVLQSRQKELDEAQTSLATAKTRNDKLTRDLELAMQRITALSQEVERLKETLRSEASADTVGTSVTNEIGEAKSLLAETEELQAVPLIPQSADAKARREAAEQIKRDREAAEAAARPVHPDTYVVQDGDTLYKIAIRFYGRSSAWVKIREANKAQISTDGRVRVGQKIVLPK